MYKLCRLNMYKATSDNLAETAGTIGGLRCTALIHS